MRIFKLSILVLALAVLTSACTVTTTSNSNKKAPDNDSSVFLSVDSGDTWRALTSLLNISDRPENISSLNVNKMTIDPSDNMAVYLASFDNGLYYTYKITEGWNKVKNLPDATINDVKVDPKDKCNIYVALANQVHRSTDCGRVWKQVYFDNNVEVAVNTIVVDHYNTNNLYIGTSRGEIIKSIDQGKSWRTIKRLEQGISQLANSPLDSRLLFVATVHNRIFSFISNTITNPKNSTDIENNFIVESWLDINDLLNSFSLGNNFRDLAVSVQDGTILLATDKVILRSNDDGVSWEKLNLIPSEKDAVINSLVVDPKNSQNIYYVTNTTFFRSNDGGVSWTTKKLPTKRAGNELLIDFNNPNVIYLGTIKLKK